jgi:hypothetical protein
MKKIDRMGVYVLMSHLIITMAILTLYGLFMYMGKDVTSIETILLVVMGYWFGAVGSNALRPNAQTQIHQANEVKVNQPEDKKEVI